MADRSDQTLMVRPDGGLTWVPTLRVDDARRDGYDLASDADTREVRNAEEFGDSAVTAALAGAGRGLSFGLSDQVLTRTGLVEKETLRGLQDYNPSASVAGEVIGTLAPLLVTGGGGAIGLGLKGMGAGVRGVSAGGRAVTAATRAALPAAKGVTGKVAREAISQAAGATLEGGAYGLGHAISEQALGDPDEVAERLMGHVGVGALTGGVAGGLFGAAGALAKHALDGKAIAKLWAKQRGLDAGEDFATASQREPPPGLASKVESELKGTYDSVGQIEGSWSAQMELELEQRVAEGAHKAIFPVSTKALDRITRKARQRAANYIGLRHEHERSMVDLSKEGQEIFEQLVDLNARGAAKVSNIEKLVKKSEKGWGEAETTALARVKGSFDEVHKMLAELATEPDHRKSGIPVIRQLAFLTDGFQKKLKKVTEAAIEAGDKQQLNADLYAMMDQFKRDVGKRIAGKVGYGTEGNIFKSLQQEFYAGPFQKMLEDESIWGKMALTQKGVNKAWSNLLDNRGVYSRDFIAWDGKKGFDKIYSMDPGKLDAHFKLLGNPAADPAKRRMLDNLQYERELVDAIEQFYELDLKSWGPKLKKFRSINEKMSKRYRQAETDMALGNAAADLRRGELPELIAAGMLGGPLVQKLTGTVLGGVTAVETIAGTYGGKITSKVSSYMRDATQKGKRAIAYTTGAGRKALVPTTTAIMRETVFGDRKKKKDQTRQEAYKDRLAELALYQGSPQALMDRLERSTSELPPVIGIAVSAKAHAAAQYLWETAPKNPSPSIGLVKQDWVPPNSELDAWARRIEVAQNPMAALDHLRNRTLTQQHVETLRAVYPRIYENVVVDIMQRAAKIGDELPYSDRVQLSLLFGVPIEPMLQPATVQLYQQMHATTPQEPGVMGSPGGNRVGGIEKLTLGERSQTQAQRIEGGLG